MRKFRIYLLLAALLGLVGLTYWLLNNNGTSPKATFGSADFGIPASSQPDSIVLAHQNEVNALTIKNRELYFNGKYRVKPELQEALSIILKQMEVRRPVSKKLHADLLAAIDSAGVQVNVYESGMLLKSFEVWGDKVKKVTYIKEPDNDNIYLVTIPGHSVYVADIFFYKENAWRNNILFQSTWRSLNKLKVQFPKAASKDFSVEFTDDFFYIPELEAFDTLALLDYLETFSNIRVIAYLPEKERVSDSILSIKPDLSIKIEDFDTANSNYLHFYAGDSLKPSNEVLVMGKDGEVGLISSESFGEIAKGDSYFSYTGSKK